MTPAPLRAHSQRGGSFCMGLRVVVLRVVVLRFCEFAILLPCIFGPTLLYKASAKQDYIGLLPDSASDRSHLSHSPPQKKTQETAKNPPAGLPSAQQRDFFLPKTFPPFVGAGHAPPLRMRDRPRPSKTGAAGRWESTSPVTTGGRGCRGGRRRGRRRGAYVPSRRYRSIRPARRTGTTGPVGPRTRGSWCP